MFCNTAESCFKCYHALWVCMHQVREYMDRITKADASALKAQTDANKAHKLARQLETDLQALR